MLEGCASLSREWGSTISAAENMDAVSSGAILSSAPAVPSLAEVQRAPLAYLPPSQTLSSSFGIASPAFLSWSVCPSGWNHMTFISGTLFINGKEENNSG
jgi:hypothetical protein